ncbi:hypothetical protein EVAR_61970_1 [Eumeta japonica]|uniref:Uncharacterized protein n=1 Tax=Eumeta variegata TaxID=151549 RepID=A0A4C1ZRA4_EUMVA|nr:hypothetical protein EVAR_61970_1 [Eumeta japonica]
MSPIRQRPSKVNESVKKRYMTLIVNKTKVMKLEAKRQLNKIYVEGGSSEVVELTRLSAAARVAGLRCCIKRRALDARRGVIGDVLDVASLD